MCRQTARKTGDTVLEVKNLSVAYGTKQVVENISFRVNDGETVSIVGESGSGKSTILRAILGLMGQEGRILDGSITFDEVELHWMYPFRHRSSIC